MSDNAGKNIKRRKSDGAALAEIRAAAMKPNLVCLGRYDEDRLRNRFLEKFEPGNTYKIIDGADLLGFFASLERDDRHYLDHIYVPTIG